MKTPSTGAAAGALALAAVLALWCVPAAAVPIAAEPAANAPAAATAGLVTVNDILNRWEPVAAAANQHHDAWRELYATQLAQLQPAWLRMLDELRPLASEGAKADYARFTQLLANAQVNVQTAQARGWEKLGSPASDLVFAPITPCRIVDTRITGTPVNAGALLRFYFYSDGTPASWAGQGGIAGGVASACPGTALTSAGGMLGNVPPAAVAATVTVVNPTAAGNFTVWGGGAPVPTTSVLNWTTGQVLANTTIIPGGGRSGGTLDFAVYYNGPSGQAQVVVDVVGYFVENTATALQCNVQLAAGSGSVASGTTATVGFPACANGYARTGGGCSTGTTLGANVYLQAESVNSSSCVFFNNSGGAIAGTSFQAEAVCCRVPGQ